MKVNVLRLAAVLALLGVFAAARSDEPPAATGRFAGPALWRVSKGDHELWLFGTLSSVPKEMKWSSAAVENAIRDSQEVLLPPGLTAATLNPVQIVRVWRRVREMTNNPGGKQLAQVLEPGLYERYSAVRDRYVRRNRNLEEQRPIAVAGRVYQDAIEELGLTSGRDVQKGIERAARRAGVETTETQVHVDPEVMLDHAARVPVQAEIDCFEKVLGTLEAGGRIAARAQAWAIGDIEALRRFDYPDIQRDCLSLPGWPDALRQTFQDANDHWFQQAERALSVNRTTFGTLDVRDLISSDGLVARLRKHGYEVRGP